MGAPPALRLRVDASTPYATPEAGYSNLREKPATGATGSAKVSATASHSSGLFTPRAHVVLGFELEPGVAVVGVGRAAGVGLQAVEIGHRGAGGILQPLPRLHPHLGAPVERAAGAPARNQ